MLILCSHTLPLDAQQTTPLTGQIIAFTPSEHDRIILYDISTDTTRELSFGTRWHTVWGFSPDGCRLLLTLGTGADATSPARLYSARLDGGDLTELVQFRDNDPDALGWGVWEPAWQATGERIVFRLTRLLADEPDGREDRIAWVAAAGGEPQFYSVSGDEHNPHWSPDGQWLVYAAYEERVPGATINATAIPTVEPPPGQPTAAPPTNLLREADLWVVSADGETKYRLTFFDTGTVDKPRWSPDGDLIGFVYSPGTGSDQVWMIGNQPGALSTQLSRSDSLVIALTWLPDSTALLGAARGFGGTEAQTLWQIPLVGDAESGAQAHLSDPALNYPDYPRFSADGQWLALRTAYALALVNTTDQSWRTIDSAPPANNPPVWSPAGFIGENACPS